MSWKASAWAKQQRLGSPAAKSILMCLADYADPTGLINGWASQARLAEDAEVSERSVREWMQKLDEWGLMTRRRQSRANGARAADVIQLNLDVFRMADGAHGEAETDSLPAESAGRSTRQLDADLPADGDHPTGTEFRAYKEIPPLSTHTPPIERERASADEREGEDGDDHRPEGLTRRAEALFFRAFVGWDRFAVSPKKPMLAAWARLSWDQMQAAADAVPRFLAANRAKGVKQACAIATFLDLEERMWEEFGPETEAAKPSVPRFEPPFGPAFAVAVWRDLVSGPKAAPPPLKAWEEDMVKSGRIDRERLERDYRARYGWPGVNRLLELGARRATNIEAGSLDHLKHLVEAVPVHTETWEAWKLEHEKRGWPWAEAFGYGRVMYFPKGGPGGLEAFERAMREAEEKGRRG